MRRERNRPGDAKIPMLANDIRPQYNGETKHEGRWGTPELHAQSIIQTHDNQQYELYSEIRYANRRYVFGNRKFKPPVSFEQVTERPNPLTD